MRNNLKKLLSQAFFPQESVQWPSGEGHFIWINREKCLLLQKRIEIVYPIFP